MSGNGPETRIDHGPVLCFESFNNSCVRFVYLSEIQILFYLFFSAISVTTVCGNLLVIIAIIHFKQLHTPTNYFILSLAVADLLIGGFVMPPSMLRSVKTCWYLGDMFCKIHSSVDIMLGNTSLLHIYFISIDRYYAVCHPLQYRNKITPPISLIMISLCWGLAAFVGFAIVFLQLNILGAEEFYFDNIACKGACIIFQTRAGSTITSILAFGLPAIITVSIYLKILLVARRQSKSIQHSTHVGKKTSISINKIEAKATKTLSIIMGVFFVSVSPFFFCNLIDSFLDHTIPPAVFDVLVWIGYLNSLCNPFVYAFFYRWFRKALRIILLAKIFQVNSSQIDLMGRND
ncbi:trace amine-associated receptor 1-like [Megalobrama amblycephala]|uniref:trace amine-associated receptor 1-like n=1 Tax=Megalobrama amblycephala TaxID=75352 RepID=UPI002013E643|nr:trace amine-associated receptor 1-like [Megalobrama amblycephala]